MGAADTYSVSCWNCLGEFDALSAVWCSHDPKNPSKLCPFCLQCFCDASTAYKQEFWKHAPPPLLEELQVLSKSKDRLGDVLIRMKKITTPQLLEALVEQKETNRRLGEILVARATVRPEDIEAALKTQGVNLLLDTKGVVYPASAVWDQSSPEGIIHYVLSLAARKGASDVQIEPTEDAITVRYRIDGFHFRVDPIPKHFQPALTRKLLEGFGLDPARESKPQASRTVARFGGTEYDLGVQTLPTRHGVSVTFKLVNRATFIKDFATLGLELADRVRLVEELRSPFGLVLVTSPVFNGSITTFYAVMNFLARAGREVLALESPIHWTMEGTRQVQVEPDGNGRTEKTLRAAMAARPDVLMLGSVPDRGTAVLVAQLASSLLVVATQPAGSAAQGLAALLDLGVPPQVLAGSLAAVTSQRLVRKICRICQVPADPPAPQTLAIHGISPEVASTLRFFRGKGCPTCNTVGYRGRAAIFELLPGTSEVRAAIQNGLPLRDIEAAAASGGMATMRERCLELVRNGTTTFDEFVRLRL
jgi:type II secretory ATPase GspE/PulE/Tfp pilus assembly ATPase PilB-like protein